MAHLLFLPALAGLGPVPVQVGLTLPPGRVGEPACLTARGARLAAAAPLGGRRPDGSLRAAVVWLVLEKTRRRVQVRVRPRPRASRVRAVRFGEELHLVAPSLRVRLRLPGPAVPWSFSRGGAVLFRSGGFRLTWAGREAFWERAEPGAVGPGRAEIRVRGRLGAAAVRLVFGFWTERPWLDLRGEVEGPPGPGAGPLALRLPLTGPPGRVRWGRREEPRRSFRWRAGDPRPRPALGAPGAWWALAVEDGALLRPVFRGASQRLEVELRRGPWLPGRSFVFRVFAYCGGTPPAARTRRLLGLVARGLPAAVPRGRGLGSLAGRTLRLFLAECDRLEYRRPDDLGDYRVPHLGWANGEYDALEVLAVAAARSGDPAVWAWARRLARHLRSVDRAPDGGLPWRHGEAHRGGRDLGHVWLQGWLRFARLTGDRAAWRHARAVARAVAATRARCRREREYGWALWALEAAARAFPAEPGLAAARDRVARALLRHVAHDLFWVEPLGGGRFRTTTFTALGILTPALAAWGEGALARRVARRYWEAAWDAHQGRLAWTLVLSRAAGGVVARRGWVRGGDLLFVAAGLRAVGLRAEARTAVRWGRREFLRGGLGGDNNVRVRALRGLLGLGPLSAAGAPPGSAGARR